MSGTRTWTQNRQTAALKPKVCIDYGCKDCSAPVRGKHPRFEPGSLTYMAIDKRCEYPKSEEEFSEEYLMLGFRHVFFTAVTWVPAVLCGGCGSWSNIGRFDFRVKRCEDCFERGRRDYWVSIERGMMGEFKWKEMNRLFKQGTRMKYRNRLIQRNCYSLI